MTVSLAKCGAVSGVLLLLAGCVSPYGYYPYGYPPPPPPEGMAAPTQNPPAAPPRYAEPQYAEPQDNAPRYAAPGYAAPGYTPAPYAPPYAAPGAYPNQPTPDGGPDRSPPEAPPPQSEAPPPADTAPPAPPAPPPPSPPPDGQNAPEAPLAAPAAPPPVVPISAPAAVPAAAPHAGAAMPHLVLEDAWQANGVWFYPKETVSLDQTGLASVLPVGHAAHTTDNEAYDPLAMMAAMQEVQLPAIAIVTNLDNGREAMVRVNDRGPADPRRLIALSPGAAEVLGIDRVARVRVRFDPVLCTALIRALRSHDTDPPVNAAPLGPVHAVSLALLAGTRQEAPRHLRQTPTPRQTGAPALPVTVPIRPPEDFAQTRPEPGPLMIDAGTFESQAAARLKAARLGASAHLVRVADGHQTSFGVETGPYSTVSSADSALDRLLADGSTDARIIVADR